MEWDLYSNAVLEVEAVEQSHNDTMSSEMQASNGFVLDDQIGHMLRRAHQRSSAAFMSVLSDHRVTPTQFFAMARLRERGQLSQNLLGRLSAMDPATIQGVTRRLSDRGYVQRLPDTTDRRRMVLSLTPEGDELLDQLMRGIDTVSGQVLAPLAPEEREQLKGLLRRIA